MQLLLDEEGCRRAPLQAGMGRQFSSEQTSWIGPEVIQAVIFGEGGDYGCLAPSTLLSLYLWVPLQPQVPQKRGPSSAAGAACLSEFPANMLVAPPSSSSWAASSSLMWDILSRWGSLWSHCPCHSSSCVLLRTACLLVGEQ